MTQTRRLAAILAADVAGYSRLMGADEEGTLAALKAIRRELGDPKVKEHRGRIVKTTGDGLLIEFASVVDAVRCAVEVQEGMAERNAEVPQEKRIEFRIGINLGDIIRDGRDIFGDGVNIAARLEALAEPGGICVSQVVHGQVRDKLDLAFEDTGEQQVKNIARPVHVWRVRLGIKPAVSASVPLPDEPSIAVLPFQNLSGDPEQEYFADGMVEEIITALSRIRWLFVIARNSSSTYKGRAVDVRQVARELGVRYVLEGSVRKASNRVRITAQLIEAETGAHLWADRFDGSLEDVFEFQDQVATNVAGVIEPALQASEIRRVARKPTSDLTAYDLCLRAQPLCSGLLARKEFSRRWHCSSRRSHATRNMGRRSVGRRCAVCIWTSTAGTKSPSAIAISAWTTRVGHSSSARRMPRRSPMPPTFWRISARTSTRCSGLSTARWHSTRASPAVGILAAI
jgi:adenylate cyclase